jgi:release factor glutamine methyltransferase
MMRWEEQHVRARFGALWRLWLLWRFRLFQQHRHGRLTLEHVGDMPILVLPDVFNPTLFHTSVALIAQLENVPVGPGMAILDMGTGSGVGAIAAARRGARVVAVDISPEAVRCARINVLLNRLEDRIEVRCGDLFEPVQGERFDLVLFNPPFYAGIPRSMWEYAWRSEDVLARFARDLPTVLSPSGRALLIVSSTTVGIDEALARAQLESQLLWKRDMINERLMVLEWTARSKSEVEV